MFLLIIKYCHSAVEQHCSTFHHSVLDGKSIGLCQATKLTGLSFEIILEPINIGSQMGT